VMYSATEMAWSTPRTLCRRSLKWMEYLHGYERVRRFAPLVLRKSEKLQNDH